MTPLGNINSFNILKSLLLVFLGVSSNFVAETLGCETQKLFSTNIVAKQAIILLILYFSLTFVSSGISPPVHPGVNMVFAGIIWALYLMFTKMHVETTMVVVALIALNYIIHNYAEYYKSTQHTKKLARKLNTVYDVINRIIIGCVVIGFGLYFKQQYTDHQSEWSTFTFIFGNVHCKNALSGGGRR